MVFSIDRAIAAGAGGGGVDIIRPFTLGVTTGDAVYQKADGFVDKADASAVATAEAFVGFVAALDSPLLGDATIRFHGDLAAFGGLVTGEVYILSTAPGVIVGLSDVGNPIYPGFGLPPASGHVIREVGNAGDATTLFVEASRDFEEL